VKKPFLTDTTLVAIDCTSKVHLAARAIQKTLEQCRFGAVKLLTDKTDLFYSVKIPKLDGLEAYSKFCIRELTKHVDTKYCLLIQWDGYMLDGQAWTSAFKDYDYLGAPFNPSGTVGNGGFSLRSKRLLEACAHLKTDDNEHPEDSFVSIRHRQELEQLGIKFAPTEVARKFAFEGRSFDSVEWKGIPNKWENACGFHSLLSVLPPDKKPCKVYHHSGDLGDIIYAMPVIKQLGEGVLFLSGSNAYPYPINTRWTRMGASSELVSNIAPLIEAQDYIWRCQYTHGLPFSTDHDLNAFRKPWKTRSARDFDSIFSLHQRVFGVSWSEDKPWITVPSPIVDDERPIVVSRSARYQNNKFPWWELVQKYGDRMRFVGTEQEAELFQGFGAPKLRIPWIKTSNLLELAQVIAGAKVCVMNQSAPLAIAHGLCKNSIVEEWPLNPNCHLIRPDSAIYWEKGNLEIPNSWLK
jgi:hypothetical protein